MAYLNDSLSPVFLTPNASGVLTNADALPTAVLRRNGTTVAGATITVTNLSTGRYKVVASILAADGFAVGDSYAIEASWAMSSAAVVQVVAQGAVRAVPLAATSYTAPPTASDVAVAVWASGTRSLTTFGTLVADVATAVWAATTRTLTSAGAAGATAAEVWAYATRTITDKTGFSLSTAPPTAAAIRTEIDSNSTQLAAIVAQTDTLESGQTSLASSIGTLQGTATTIAGYTDTLESGQASLASSVGALPAAVWSHASGKLVRASAGGKWTKPTADSIRLYDTDGTTILVTLTLAPSGGPYTSATPS